MKAKILRQLLSNNLFIFLYLGSILVTASTIVLVLYFSSNILERSGSVFSSSSIIVSAWLLAFVLTPQLCNLAERYSASLLLMLSSVVASIIVIALSYFENSFPMVLGLFACRGVLEALNKTTSNILIKQIIASSLQESAFAFFNNSRFIGSFLGGIVYTAMVPTTDFHQILCLNLYFFAIIMCLYTPLLRQKLGPMPRGHRLKTNASYWSDNFRKLRSPVMQSKSFLYVLLSGGMYFGIYHLSRVTFPMEVLHAGSRGVAFIQIIATAATFLASTIVSLCINNGKLVVMRGYRLGIKEISVMAALAIAMTILPMSRGMGYCIYFFYVFFFQMTYTIALSHIMASVSLPEVANISTFVNASSTFIMILFIVLTSLLMDYMGYQYALGFITTIIITLNVFIILHGAESENNP